jgi:hypothetical protein
LAETYAVKRLELYLNRKLLRGPQSLEVSKLDEYGRIYSSIYEGSIRKQLAKPLNRNQFRSLTQKLQRYLRQTREEIEKDRGIAMPEDYMVMRLYDLAPDNDAKEQGRILAEITENDVSVYPPR